MRSKSSVVEINMTPRHSLELDDFFGPFWWWSSVKPKWPLLHSTSAFVAKSSKRFVASVFSFFFKEAKKSYYLLEVDLIPVVSGSFFKSFSSCVEDNQIVFRNVCQWSDSNVRNGIPKLATRLVWALTQAALVFVSNAFVRLIVNWVIFVAKSADRFKVCRFLSTTEMWKNFKWFSISCFLTLWEFFTQIWNHGWAWRLFFSSQKLPESIWINKLYPKFYAKILTFSSVYRHRQNNGQVQIKCHRALAKN